LGIRAYQVKRASLTPAGRWLSALTRQRILKIGKIRLELELHIEFGTAVAAIRYSQAYSQATRVNEIVHARIDRPVLYSLFSLGSRTSRLTASSAAELL
jgi:hypothetical protein